MTERDYWQALLRCLLEAKKARESIPQGDSWHG